MTTCSFYSHTLYVLCVLYVCVAYSGVSGTACQPNGIQYVENADVRFGLMLQLREHASGIAPNDCQISARYLQHYLTVEWLLEKINSYNNGTGYIPGVKIGYTSYDDCGISIYSARNAISFLNDSLSYMTSTCEGAPSHTVSDIAIIGPSSSSSSMAVSSLIKDYQIPIISPMSTVTELSDKTLYPNFFRTVPSDDHHMSLIVDILDELRWTYISVVYQNDDYGQSARRVLDQKAKDKGICIHSPDLSLPQGDDVIGDHFEHVLATARKNSIAVVVIADSVQTEQLLFAVEARVQLYKRGLHFILTNAVNLDISVFKNVSQGQGTLSFSTPSELLKLEDLKKHITEKFKDTQTDDQHPLVEEYFQTHSQSPSFDSFLPSTINAVMALVESLKTLHNDTCGGVFGPCPTLTQALKDGELLKHLSNVQVKYSSIPEAVVPVQFHESQVSFSFNDHGDLQFGIPNLSFTIHSYDSTSRNYKEVGSYVNGNVQLDISKIEWLSPSGNPLGTGYNPNSMCAGEQCVKCRNNDLVPIMHLPGDVYIVGIFSLHETDVDDPFKCGAYRHIANDAIAAEGFLYSVKELEAKTGIKFGAIGFDACSSQLRITSILTDFFSDNSPLYSQLFPVRISRDRVAGVIGCLSSGCTIVASNFFTALNIPSISYAATSPDLDDTIDFPYFMRMVPSDAYQAQVMVSIIKEMGWEYVGLLYVNNNQGAKGMEAFRNIVDIEGSGICAAKEFSISNTKEDNNGDVVAAYNQLNALGVKVVVFFGTDSRARDFIRYVEHPDRSGKFIFLAREDWGSHEEIKDAGPTAARGSLTLKLQTVGLESEDTFKSHLQNKKPSLDDTNVWFREFLEGRNMCHFRGSFHSEYPRECDPDQGLTPGQIIKGVTNERTRHTMNAVYAMGRGLQEVINNYCQGEPTRYCVYLKDNPEGVVDHIMKQKILDGSEEVNVFDADGNGAIGYNVYNIQLRGSAYKYEEVGQFRPRNGRNSLSKERMKFYNAQGAEMFHWSAVCESDERQCDFCQHRKPVVPADEEKTNDASCSDFRDSDILHISLVCISILAVAAAVIAAFICYRSKCRKAVKSIKANVNRPYEQVRQVYQGEILLQPANLQFSHPNVSPYVLCQSVNEPGISNPALLSDSDEHYSGPQTVPTRVVYIDNSRNGAITSGNANPNTDQNLVSPSTSSPRPSDNLNSDHKRTTPMVFIRESENEFREDNETISVIRNATLQRQSPIDPTTPSLMPLNVKTSRETPNVFKADNHSDVVFAKDANGKLVAYVALSETLQSSSNHNISYLNSDTLQNAPANSGLRNIPTSLQKQTEEQLREQNMPANPFMARMMTPPNVNDATMYEDIEIHNIRQGTSNNSDHAPIAQGQQQQQQQHIPFHQAGDQRFPLQYTSPTHNIPTPISHSNAIPAQILHLSAIQQQDILQQQQQQIRRISEPASTNQLQTTGSALQQHLWKAQHPYHQTVSPDDQYPHNTPQWKGGSEEDEVFHEPQRIKDEASERDLTML